MSFHASAILEDAPQRTLGEWGDRLFKLGAAAGLIGLAVAGLLMGIGGEHAVQRVLYAYIVGFAFFFSIALAALLFVMVHFLAKTGTVTTYRRLGEILAGSILPFGILGVIPVLAGVSEIYHWMHPYVYEQVGDELVKHPDAIIKAKASYLNGGFFIGRMIAYVLILGGLGQMFLRISTKQDANPDPVLTQRMQARATWGTILFAICVTFFATDLIKSLDPHWFSTIFGVYYFAGGFMAFHAVLALSITRMQKRGLLTQSINKEHFHDMGKMMFAMMVFWTYIAFSQYMLIWYANVPEETVWYIRRGATTDPNHVNGWSYICLLLLFAHFFVPFLGMVSRHIKRNRGRLCFWAAWLLVIHFVDMIWLIRPELRDHHLAGGPTIPVNWVDVTALAACAVGVGGVFLAIVSRVAAQRSLVAHNDPRLSEGLAFENV